MSEAENLFGEEHVRRYRETGGEVGHRWKRGSKILLLTTKGRKSGEPRTKPLIYEEDGDRYVIVASKGGAPDTSRLVPESREGAERRAAGARRRVPCACSHCGGRGARAAVAARQPAVAGLRQLPDEDRPGDSGGRPGARVRLSRSASARERARRLAVGADAAKEVRDGDAGRVDGWSVSARARLMVVTSGRIGCRYFERPHETEAV